MYIILTVYNLILCIPDKEALENRIYHEKRVIADNKWELFNLVSQSKK